MYVSKLIVNRVFLTVLWLVMSAAGARASALDSHWTHNAIVLQLPEGLQVSDQLTDYLPIDCIKPLSIRPLKMLSAVTANSGYMNALNLSTQGVQAFFYQLDDQHLLNATTISLPSSMDQESHQILIEGQGVEGVDQAAVILTKDPACQLSAAKIHIDENSAIDTYLVTGCEKGGRGR